MTTPKTETRMERGIRLFRERGHEIIEVEPGIYPDHEHRQVRCLHFYAALIFAAKKRCRRASARPERRHGRPGDTTPRRGGNKEGQRWSSDTPGGRAVGSGYGLGEATVLAGLDRMGS